MNRIAQLKHELAQAEHDLALENWQKALKAYVGAAEKGPSVEEASLHQDVITARAALGRAIATLDQAAQHGRQTVTLVPPKARTKRTA